MLETNNAGYENSYEKNYIIKSKIDNCVRTQNQYFLFKTNKIKDARNKSAGYENSYEVNYIIKSKIENYFS